MKAGMSNWLIVSCLVLTWSLFGTLELYAQTTIEAANVHQIDVKNPEEGTITVQGSGFGRKIADSNADALSGIFYTILFRGVPGGKYNQPLITDEDTYKDDSAVREILTGGYNTFTTKSVVLSSNKTTKKSDGTKGFRTTVQVTVNYVALRKHLEGKGVIRKFGY